MPSSTFLRLPEEKRDTLLRCARMEFSSTPFEQVSINRIIHAAGIPRGSFYMYFSDKEDLFCHLMELYGQRLVELIQARLQVRQGDLFSSCLDLFDLLCRIWRDPDGCEELAQLMSIIRLNRRMQPYAFWQPACGSSRLLEQLRAPVDPTPLNLACPEDLDDIIRLVTGVTVACMMQAGHEGEIAARRRLVRLFDLFKWGMARPPAQDEV